ncbi:MAG: MlaD family protein [Thermoleophilaceae bacterium]
MRRLLAGALLSASLIGLLIFGVAARDGGGSGYEVRAIFDDAASAVPGEDVRIAGAKVGSIGKMDVTPQRKASVVLKIDDSGFTPFHADATCTVRPQSLIGEKYVECEPGSPSRPALRKVPKGRTGAGQHLLPLSQTSSPVDLDLVNDVMRLPYRQRLSIVLAELGAGFAGRGQDLNALIHRANPALRQTDRVLKQLADENVTLRELARDSDQALAPLARDRRHLSGFIEHATTVGEATAARRADIERSIQRLPRFLRELKPTMQDLGAVSDEMTPVLTDLGSAAPSLDRFVLQLGPFSRSANRALQTLGHATDIGGPVLERARPVVQDLRSFARTARPVAANLDALTASIDRTGGIEQAMNYLFFTMSAVNGFDSIGHYLRAGLIVNACSNYTTTPAPGCAATFTEVKSVPSSAAGSSDATLARTGAALRSASAAPTTGARAKPLKQSPAQTLSGLVQRLLSLGRTHAHHRVATGASAALDQVGGRDQALLGYLMGTDR